MQVFKKIYKYYKIFINHAFVLAANLSRRLLSALHLLNTLRLLNALRASSAFDP